MGEIQKKTPVDPVDAAVGKRIRMLRKTTGWSQKRIASCIGVSFQQVQKYEKGENRIGVSKLVRLSEETKTPIGWFFLGVLPEKLAAEVVVKQPIRAEDMIHLEHLYNSLPRHRAAIRMFTRDFANCFKHQSVNDNGGGDSSTS